MKIRPEDKREIVIQRLDEFGREARAPALLPLDACASPATSGKIFPAPAPPRQGRWWEMVGDGGRILTSVVDRGALRAEQMTTKEAWRKLNHNFHGKKPGAKKVEKRRKQFEEEMRLKKINAGEQSVEQMQKAPPPPPPPGPP
jgi:hypothetical protein